MRFIPAYLRVIFCLIGCLCAIGTRAVSVSQQGNRLLIDGKPTTITFARGCEDPGSVPAYHALGLNTLLIHLDSLEPAQFDQAEALLNAAQAEKMYVLIELSIGSWMDGRRANSSNEQYVDKANTFLREAMDVFGKHPSVIGWVISTVQEGTMVSDIGTVSEFIQEKYGSIDNLNEVWGAKDSTGKIRPTPIQSFSMLEKIPLQDVLKIVDAKSRKTIQADYDEYARAISERDTDFASYLEARYPSLRELNQRWQFRFDSWEDIRVSTIMQREKARPGSSPLSQLEFARYQSRSASALMDWWAARIREQDSTRLIFAGGQYSYRTLISLPHSVNGVFTECYPGVTEPDATGHNPQAFDMARRGNQFIVLAGILCRQVDPMHLTHYIYEAAMHGAAGVGILDWPSLASSANQALAVKTALGDVEQRRLFNRTPTPRVAIVYSPFAFGAISMGRSLYGYMPSFLYGGPALMMFFFRQGTAYGQVDYLSVDDLTKIPLDQYQTLIFPSVLDWPVKTMNALVPFVTNGGTILADIGAGCLQGNGNYSLLPEHLCELFGVMNGGGLTDSKSNLLVDKPAPWLPSPEFPTIPDSHPRFPSMQEGLRASGIEFSKGYMILRSAAMIPMAYTDLLCTVTPDNSPQRPKMRERPKMPEFPVKRKVLPRRPTRGMFIVQHGKGFAVYAPFTLYQYWLPGYDLFETFHRDLFMHGCDVALVRPIDFLPRNAEVTSYYDGSVALWIKDNTCPLIAQINNPLRLVFSAPGGKCQVGPKTTAVRFDAPGYHLATPLPVALPPCPDVLNFSVTRADKQGFDITVTSAEERTAAAMIKVGSGEYVIVADSEHRVTCITRSGEQTLTFKADEQGVLSIPLPAEDCRILINGTTTAIEILPLPRIPDNQEQLIDAIPPAVTLPLPVDVEAMPVKR